MSSARIAMSRLTQRVRARRRGVRRRGVRQRRHVSLITITQSGDTVEGSLGVRRGGSVILQNGSKTLPKAFKEGHVVETPRARHRDS
jgi:hypothetical protein